MKLLKSGWIQRSELKRPIQYLSLHQNISREDEEPMFQDIKEHGQREPVTIDQKFNLLDGYTRDEFLEELEKPKIKFEQYQFESESEKLAYIVSKNRMRRHLSTYQKCEWAIPVYEQAKKEAEKRQKKGTLAYKKAKAAEIAAKATGVSTSTFEQYLTIRSSPARVNKQTSLESGKTTIKTVYLQITRKERNLPKIKLPKEISDVFYCDVPIGYRNQGGRGAAENHYPTMEPEELVEEFRHIAAADNAVIFFWMSPSICYDEIPIFSSYQDITGKTYQFKVNTPIYKAILDAAGFKVKAEFVWKKNKWGVGSWNRNQHENLLFAIKGEMPTPAKLFSSVIEEIRTSHSKKPKLHKMIMEMYPKRNYQELYGKEKVAGWRVHGNQIKKEAPLVA